MSLKKEVATEIRDHALKAIEELMRSRTISVMFQHAQIERGAGLSIGKIQMEILEVINAFPELDDLVNVQPIRDLRFV